MKPLAEIALRYKLGEVLVKHDGQADEVKRAAAVYSVEGKKLGLVITVMLEGASASLMRGAPLPDDCERWKWLETGCAQVERLLQERPELAVQDVS